MMVGDLPDMYWTLLLPECVSEFFCLPGLTPIDLQRFMRRTFATEVDVPPGATAVAMQVPVMGWCWAVSLAQMTLEDLLDREVGAMRASARLNYKVVLPQFAEACRVLHWVYIDDVGAMIWNPGAAPGPAPALAARALGAEVRAALARNGLGYHKDDYGETCVTLGFELGPSSFGVRPLRAKVFEVGGAIEQLLVVRRAAPKTIEKLVGAVSWLMLAARPAFSIWRRVYGFARRAPDHVVTEVPDEVLAEFQAALWLLPLLGVSMKDDWADAVFMTDSCFEGAAVIETKATATEMEREAAFAETRGWSTFALDPDGGPGVPEDGGDDASDGLESELVLVAGFGGACLEDFLSAVADAARRTGTTVEFVGGPGEPDVVSDEVYSTVRAMVQGTPRVKVVLFIPSAALPGSEKEPRRAAKRARLLALLGEALVVGAPLVACSTAAPPEFHEQLLKKGSAGRLTCTSSGRTFWAWAASAEEFPAEGRGTETVDHLVKALGLRETLGATGPEREWATRAVPSIGQNWDDISRWKETFRTTWSVRDHNNLGEIRGVLLALRHAARSPSNFEKKLLIFTDSQVALGSLMKGRSSAWPVLRLCRVAAAVELSCGIRLFLRYVESERNHADGPSRGHRIGQAPKWSK